VAEGVVTPLLPLADAAESASRRIAVHASLVRDVQRGLKFCGAVVVSREHAVSVLSDLFARVHALPPGGPRLLIEQIASQVEWRVDPFKAGALDVGMVETMSELLAECAKQMRRVAVNDCGQVAQDVAE
jgi:hypothetical protein